MFRKGAVKLIKEPLIIRRIPLSFKDLPTSSLDIKQKILESPLECKEIQPVHSKDQSWVCFGRNDTEAETPVLWRPHAKS